MKNMPLCLRSVCSGPEVLAESASSKSQSNSCATVVDGSTVIVSAVFLEF